MNFIFRRLFLFVNNRFYVFTCHWFSHSSVPGTSTSSVRRTPKHTDSHVTFPDRTMKGKPEKKDWKVIMDVYLIFWIKFQNCFISTCFISLTFDISSAFRFVFWCSNHGCALIQPYTCVCNMCIISSFVINSSVGFIISVHTSPCFFAP